MKPSPLTTYMSVKASLNQDYLTLSLIGGPNTHYSSGMKTMMINSHWKNSRKSKSWTPKTLTWNLQGNWRITTRIRTTSWTSPNLLIRVWPVIFWSLTYEMIQINLKKYFIVLFIFVSTDRQFLHLNMKENKKKLFRPHGVGWGTESRLSLQL